MAHGRVQTAGPFDGLRRTTGEPSRRSMRVTIRDIGRLAVRVVPPLEGLARSAYRWLPAWLHDTPTRRIARFFEKDATVGFVQIGAYDGAAGDPLRPLVLNHGFRGVLVEPQAAAFRALERNYAAQASRLELVNAAVDVAAGTRSLFHVAADDPGNAGLPAWAFEVSSFDAAHVRKHFPTARIDATPIRTVRFADIVGGLPDECVDLVVIDVEGAERAILDSIDLDRHRVRFVMYEHKHLSPEDAEAVTARLRRTGFSLKAFGRDTIAWRRLPL